MKIAVLSNVRTDNFFLSLWLEHYGAIFGRENLHLMLDGDDWTPEVDLTGVTVKVVPNVPRDRQKRLSFTARWQSGYSNTLLRNGVDLVLRTDIDEFVVADPAIRSDLPALLAQIPEGAAIAALGIDVIQGPKEGQLDLDRPILDQRRNAVITREFSKLVAVRRNLRWVGGFHRARQVDIEIMPGLLLFHLALFDRGIAAERINQRKSTAEHATQGAHIRGRLDRFDEVSTSVAHDFDSAVEAAIPHLMTPVPSPTGPHPGIIPNGNLARGYHVRLPERVIPLLPALRAAYSAKPAIPA